MFYGYLTVPSVSPDPELSQFVHCCLYATTMKLKLVFAEYVEDMQSWCDTVFLMILSSAGINSMKCRSHD